jgi:pectate lyase
MFKVSGIIALNSALEIKQPNLTIAGQTAPGDGICIKNYSVVVKASNVVIRYLRFRMGDEKQTADDALWGREQKNIIIDHCSMSWSTDECSSFYDNENFTMQWCIISESLRVSVHAKGNHGYGGIWGGKGASFHHNLLAHHDSRNPRFCGSRYSNQPAKELVDFRNNVIYNWGSNSGYAGEGGSYNFVGNYYKPGAETSNPARIFQPYADDGTNSQPVGVWGKFYVSDNYMLNKDGTPNTSVNSDNWAGMTPSPSSKSKPELRSDAEFGKGEIETHTAEQAFTLVLQHAGASFRRDATDTRVASEVRDGLTPKRASVSGGGTKAGLIDTQTDVGGWDTYADADAPLDTDGDGIPDTWEESHGLNKADPADGVKYNLSPSCTNVEVYVNGITSGN